MSNHRPIIPPLLGERAGVRASFSQPRYEALTNRFMARFIILLAALFLATNNLAADTSPSTTVRAAEALIARVVPDAAQHFIVETIPPDNGHDVFEVESRGDKIVLRGNTAVSIASALNWYLENPCHCEISWNAGEPTQLAASIAVAARKNPCRQPAPVSLCLQFLHVRLHDGVVGLAGFRA